MSAGVVSARVYDKASKVEVRTRTFECLGCGLTVSWDLGFDGSSQCDECWARNREPGDGPAVDRTQGGAK